MTQDDFAVSHVFMHSFSIFYANNLSCILVLWAYDHIFILSFVFIYV